MFQFNETEAQREIKRFDFFSFSENVDLMFLLLS